MRSRDADMNDQTKTKEQLIAELQDLRKRVAELDLVERLHSRIQEELRKSEERFRSLVNSTDDSIYVVDKECNYLFMNRKHLTRMGLDSSEDLNGRNYRDFHLDAETENFQSYVDTVFRTGQSVTHEYQAARDQKYFIRTLSPVRNERDMVSAVTVVSKEITDRKRMEEELRALSLTDELTQLYNRRGLMTLLQQEMRIASRLGKDAVLFLVDMDDLKVINDKHGHHAGDQAIRDAAEILKRSFRESDILSRIGGDEFVIFMIEHSDVDPGTLARRLQDIVRIYNSQVTRPYVLSLSIGWVRYESANPASIDELLRQADAFMYERKRSRVRDTA